MGEFGVAVRDVRPVVSSLVGFSSPLLLGKLVDDLSKGKQASRQPQNEIEMECSPLVDVLPLAPSFHVRHRPL
jgi:hypothetical protein